MLSEGVKVLRSWRSAYVHVFSLVGLHPFHTVLRSKEPGGHTHTCAFTLKHIYTQTLWSICTHIHTHQA